MSIRRLAPAPVQQAIESVLYRPELREARLVKELLARSFVHSDAECAAEYQRRKLSALLSGARAEIPYYADLLAGAGSTLPASLDGLPLLDKSIIRRNGARMISRGAGPLNSFRFNTGGSTGEPLQFVASRACGLMDRCHHTFLFELSGYTAGDTVVAFDGAVVPERQRAKGVFWERRTAKQLPYGSYHFSSHYFSKDTEEHYLRKFMELKPAYLRGYPSFISQFAEALSRRGGKPTFVKGVHLTAETVHGYQVEAIERAFGCPVHRQYGHSEMAVFGFCLPRSERYYCSPFYGVTEVLDADGRQVSVGEEGEIVVTGLHNRIMPLVRYRTGDRAEFGGSFNGFTVLERMQGRTQDVLIARDGTRVAVTGLIFGQHFHAFARIAKWQLVQERIGEVEAVVVPREDFGKQDEQEILARLSEGSRLTARIRFVEDIELTRRGKAVFVVNHVGQ